MAGKWLVLMLEAGYDDQMLLCGNFHTFLLTGPLYDPWPKWLLCESLGLTCHHCRQPLLHSVFPSDGGSRVREEYANQHGSGQVSKDVTVTHSRPLMSRPYVGNWLSFSLLHCKLGDSLETWEYGVV